MKIVMLPGLDGTGELFSPMLPLLVADYRVISLPLAGGQDYQTLTEYVQGKLPNEDFVLLAESFSGPIAARIAQTPPTSLRGVIFVATFLSPPVAVLLGVAQSLPLTRLSRLPFSAALIRWLMLGSQSSDELLEQFRSIVEHLPAEVVQGRIRAIRELRLPEFYSALPALYIQARRDRLIPEVKWREFASCFGDISWTVLDAPHFILQTRPEECAVLINRFVESCGQRPDSREAHPCE